MINSDPKGVGLAATTVSFILGQPAASHKLPLPQEKSQGIAGCYGLAATDNPGHSCFLQPLMLRDAKAAWQ